MGLDSDGVLTRGNIVGDLHLEGHEAALVVAGLHAVDVNKGLIVHCAEVQEDAASALLFGQSDLLLIPYSHHKVLVTHTGQLRLGSKGHIDGLCQLIVGICKATGLTTATVIDLKVPNAVQILPILTLKLGLGVFQTVNLFHSLKSFPMYILLFGSATTYFHKYHTIKLFI